MLSDEELVSNYQHKQSSKYINELYRRYQPKILGYCFAIIKNKDTAEDLTQDIFIKITENLHKLNTPSTFSAWCFRIARNHCINFYKKQSKTKAEKLEETLELADEIVDIEEFINREQQFDLIEVLINELDEDEKMILQLKYLEKASIKDIQKSFPELSESAVKMRLTRVRQKLARLYNKRSLKREKG